MYRFYVTIGKGFKQYYDVQIPTNGKMDLVQAIDTVYGHFGKIYPNNYMTCQFISLTALLKQ